ncbi:hypothetical protein K1720_02100 [Thermococcus argininiproducens]|uniref:Uncharacterized protein n=1 Tax=Thermococcus argininiproducens TaxID=2866384 RepID=A0A9E7MB73_9EURY|nr:hypothetical protein [Thermococcus argininiproducens]USH00288.1 hypothetical protein K1720_02100 [Thermococcus argininiproducens]
MGGLFKNDYVIKEQPSHTQEIIQKGVDKESLNKLLERIKEGDLPIKIRTLQILNEKVKLTDIEQRKRFLEEGLETLLENLFDENQRIQELTLRVLESLIKGISLPVNASLKIFETISIPRILENDFVFLQLANTFKALKFIKPHPSILNYLTEMTLSGDDRVRVLGTWGLWRFLNSTRDIRSTEILEGILSKIPSLLESEDETVVEVTLELIKEIATKYQDSGEIIKRSFAWIKVMKEIEKSGSWLIRSELKRTINYLIELIREYYRMRINESFRVLEDLIQEERYEDAMTLAGIIGNEDIIKWVSQKIKENKREKEKGIEGLPRLVSGPKYLNIPSDLTEKTIYIPSLSSLALRKKTVGNDGNVNSKFELNKMKKDLSNLMTKLRSSDSVEIIDALWELYELSDEINSQNVEEFRLFVPELLRIFSSTNNEWMVDKTAKILAKILGILPNSQEYTNDIAKFLFLEDKHKMRALIFFKYYLKNKWDKNAWELILKYLPRLLTKKKTAIWALGIIEIIIDTIPPEETERLRELMAILGSLNPKVPEIMERRIKILIEEINKKLKGQRNIENYVKSE